MNVFADSSAIVKIYADEEGSAIVRSLPALAASALVQVEVPAALWRKVRAGGLREARARHLLTDFAIDAAGSNSEPPRLSILAVNESLLVQAGALTGPFRLRAYDAVQLASALRARSTDPRCTTFACFDGDLRAAAAASGFELVP